MNIKNLILIASLVFSCVGNGQSRVEAFSCVDGSLGDVFISIELTSGSYSLFNHVRGEKLLVDQGLDCKFSADGTQLFICSKKLSGARSLVQYYSETNVVESMMDPKGYTTFYQQKWESDVRKPKKVIITSIYGKAQEQCK